MTQTADTTCNLLYIGPFPGPVSGQTVMTQLLYDHLAAHIGAQRSITPIDTVRGNYANRWVNAAVKIARSLAAFVRVLLGAWGKNCYISLNSNFGMVLSLAYVFAARLGGCNRVILHHHSRDHIDRTSPVMRALVWLAGRGAVHLCICPNMARQLQARYPAIRLTAHLSNVVGLDPAPPAPAPPKRPDVWRLGHMAKLTMDKGLGRCIEALEFLQARGISAELTLAGPFSTPADRAFALAAKARLGDALHLEGLLTGTAKADWFAGLDLFLFPSLYHNETQGIVNLEALAAGTPVIAFGGHCIEDDLAGLSGWCLPVTADFSAHVLARITGIGRDGWQDQRAMARQRFEDLHAQSRDDLAGFSDLCFARDLGSLGKGVTIWPR